LQKNHQNVFANPTAGIPRDPVVGWEGDTPHHLSPLWYWRHLDSWSPLCLDMVSWY